MSTGELSPIPDVRYPVGSYTPPEAIDAEIRTKWIADLKGLPVHLRNAVIGLTEQQLDTPYRLGGWTVRQVVHHVADSHLNSYTRFRLALTEDSPLIKTYDEKSWAELPDAKQAPIDPSLHLIEGLHARWVRLLSSMSEGDFARTFKHPELGEIRLDWTLGLYAWHCRHHVAHITALRTKEHW